MPQPSQCSYQIERHNPYLLWIGRRDPMVAVRSPNDQSALRQRIDDCRDNGVAPSAIVGPSIMRDASVESVMTPEREQGLLGVLNFIKEFLVTESVRVTAIGVSGFIDDEELSEQIIVTLHTLEPSDSALGFWDRVILAMEEWLPTNSDKLRRTIRGSIFVNVRWRIDADSF